MFKLSKVTELFYLLYRWPHFYHCISYPVIESIPRLQLCRNSSTQHFCPVLHIFKRLHHLVTLWLFLDFSRVLRISCSSSNQTLFIYEITGSYWNPTKVFLLEFKGALSDLRRFLATENPLKMLKNAFYFTLKALFVLKIIKFLF